MDIILVSETYTVVKDPETYCQANSTTVGKQNSHFIILVSYSLVFAPRLGPSIICGIKINIFNFKSVGQRQSTLLHQAHR